MPAADIVIKGAREHNLRDVQLELPRNRLICLTGVSGSGKSSLAFDTLYAEGQRRYIESLSSFARQFLGQMPKPDVDHISGLSPSISISQKSSGQNPRSTVGTITEIYDYLRLLYARTGIGHCPHCRRPITAQTREQIIARIGQLPAGTKFSVLAPLIRAQKGQHKDLLVDLVKQGFMRARVDGRIVHLTDDLQLDRQMRHNIEVVVDRLAVGQPRARLAEAVDTALKLGEGSLIVAPEAGDEGKRPAEAQAATAAKATPADIQLSAQYACTHCGISFEPPTPQLFSFNSPQGMCRSCDGLGERYSFDPHLLVPNDALSFKQGCFELIGPWKEMGRWRRHIFQGVAETIERTRSLPSGTMLETPWRDLSPERKQLWLDGTGDEHITFTWRGGTSGQKYGGKFEGIIPQLLARHRSSKSKMQLRQLEKYMCVLACTDCNGERINAQARAVTLASRHADFADRPERSLAEVCRLSIAEAVRFFSELEQDATRQKIAAEVLKEVRGRLGFLVNVGLEYLSLDRTAPTLSGGESQRIRLAGQIGCGLVGVLYILDEPSIGLHPRDNDRLLDTLTHLRDMGNTVVVVEHDEDTMRAADHIVDFGPGPGVRGGEVVAQGTAHEIAKAERSLTGQYLSGKLQIDVPAATRPIGDKRLRIVGARHNNLKNIDVDVPLGALVCVTGVSGSGKSSLVNDILVEALRRDLNGGLGEPGTHERIEGLEHLDKLIAIDQSPIGRTPRSNPSTYIKLFDEIRDLYTQLPESKTRGYKAGRFSFNVSGGRCEACEGNGSNRLEMDFLADIWVTCPVCEGHRFNRETLQVKFKGRSISEVLEMDVQQALEHFENIPKIRHKLQTLHDVGLDYLKLGQPSPTLSGGEAQRIKLARELVKKSTGRTLYLLDEPTTGLHFADIKMLLKVLHDFVDAGNTVVVVEHNLDVIKTADWIVDLGPEGGAAGGQLVAAGPPAEVAKHKVSHTGRKLRELLDGTAARQAASRSRPKPSAPLPTTKAIRVQGARQHNLKGVDVEIPRDKMTVCCGLSGSGKSSLAMDTVYAEGQRRYVESLSSYARQFVGQMPKAAARSHRGAVAGHRDRAEADGPYAPLDGRHRDRDLRLPADSDGPVGAALLPRLRHSDRHPNGRRDRRQDHGRTGRHQAVPDGAAGDQRRRKVRNLVGRDPGRRLCASPGRRHDLLDRSAADDRPPPQASGRGGGRPDQRSLRRRARGLPTASKTLWRWATACCTWPGRTTTCPSRSGRSRSTASTLPATAAAQLRAAHAAQLFVQWGARLVPGLRRVGHPDRGQPGRAARDPKLTLRAGAVALWPSGRHSIVRSDARSPWPADRRAAGRAVRATQRQAAARGDARPRRAVDRRAATGQPQKDRSPAAAVPVQGALSGPGRSGPALPRPALAVGTPGRSGRLRGVRRQPAARRCLGRAAQGSHDRRPVPLAAGRIARPGRQLEARRPRAEDRRRAVARSAESPAVFGRRGLGISDARPPGPDL